MPHVSSDINRKLRRSLQIVTIFCTFYVAVEWIVTLCDHNTKSNSGLLSLRVQPFFSHFESVQPAVRPLVYITVTIVKIVTRNKLNVTEFNCP